MTLALCRGRYRSYGGVGPERRFDGAECEGECEEPIIGTECDITNQGDWQPDEEGR